MGIVKKCSDDYIVKVMLDAMGGGKYFKGEKDFAKFIHEICGYSTKKYSTAYRRVKELEGSGRVKYVPRIGYCPVLTEDREHNNLIRKALLQLLNFISKGEVILEENELYYGQRLSRDDVESHINSALEHLLSSKPRLQEVVEEFNRLVDNACKIYDDIRSIYAKSKEIETRINNLLTNISSMITYVFGLHHYEKPEYSIGRISEVIESYKNLRDLYERLKDFFTSQPQALGDNVIEELPKKVAGLRDSWIKLEREINVKVDEFSHSIIEILSNEQELTLPGVCEYCSIGKSLVRHSEYFKNLIKQANEFRNNLYKWVKMSSYVRPLIVISS